jgi:hypothetical protein
MKINKPILSVIAALIFIGTAAFVHIIFNNTIYLPIVIEPPWTPSRTPSPTQKGTATPTRTPTSKYNLSIVKIVNLNSMNPLNEYVSIINNGYNTAVLTDWYIKDDGPNRYNFYEGFSIARGETIRLWTRSGINTATDLYWDSAVEVWNDSGDCAYLRDDSTGLKILVDKYCYTTGDDGLMILIQDP